MIYCSCPPSMRSNLREGEASTYKATSALPDQGEAESLKGSGKENGLCRKTQPVWFVRVHYQRTHHR